MSTSISCSRRSHFCDHFDHVQQFLQLKGHQLQDLEAIRPLKTVEYSYRYIILIVTFVITDIHNTRHFQQD